MDMSKVLELLFGSWVGLSSLFVILFMVGMAVFFIAMYFKKTNEDPPS
jgi:hypothetical protein